jgi:hypothetical protein
MIQQKKYVIHATVSILGLTQSFMVRSADILAKTFLGRGEA